MSARQNAASGDRLTSAISALRIAGQLAATALLSLAIHDQQQAAGHGGTLTAATAELLTVPGAET